MRVLLVGVVVAAYAGLLAGEAMQPVLGDPHAQVRPYQPTRQAANPDGGVNWSAYGAGKTPDYVIGTDWLPADHGDAAWSEPLAEPDWSEPVTHDPPARRVRMVIEEPPAPAHPSQEGDILAGVGPSAPENEPPVPDV